MIMITMMIDSCHRYDDKIDRSNKTQKQILKSYLEMDRAVAYLSYTALTLQKKGKT